LGCVEFLGKLLNKAWDKGKAHSQIYYYLVANFTPCLVKRSPSSDKFDRVLVCPK